MIIASNFKTNYTREKTKHFVRTVQEAIQKNEEYARSAYLYPATTLDAFHEVASLHVGAQNFYPVDNGSFTGEIGLSNSKSLVLKRCS